MKSGRGGTVHYPRAKQLSKYPGETAEKWEWNTVVFAEVRQRYSYSSLLNLLFL
jgi:hypothetical protein